MTSWSRRPCKRSRLGAGCHLLTRSVRLLRRRVEGGECADHRRSPRHHARAIPGDTAGSQGRVEPRHPARVKAIQTGGLPPSGSQLQWSRPASECPAHHQARRPVARGVHRARVGPSSSSPTSRQGHRAVWDNGVPDTAGLADRNHHLAQSKSRPPGTSGLAWRSWHKALRPGACP